MIALGAVALYALGVIGSIGQLRSSHVDVSEGFGLIPLERHLRVGIATLFSGPVFLVVASVALLAPFFAEGRKFDAWAQDPERHKDAIEAHRRRRTQRHISRLPLEDLRLSAGRVALRTRLGIRLMSDDRSTFLPRVGAGLMLVLAPMSPWPGMLVLLAFAGGLWALPRLVDLLPKQPGKRFQYYVAIFVVLSIGLAAFDGYFRSRPLPQASVTKTTGHLNGPLIAVTDGVVYLGTKDQDKLYQAVPVSKVVGMVSQRRRRIEEQSIIQMLGLDFPRKRCLNPVRRC